MAPAKKGQINFEQLPTLGSRTIDCFEKLELIGQGTFGQVYRARESETGEIVALKRIRMETESEGFPITSIREIYILKSLKHTNLIKLKEIVTSLGHDKEIPGGNMLDHDIYMVFEYMEHDLTGLSERPGLIFSVPEMKCYMKQLLTGLHYCHVNGILHRDIKGSNLLINNKGTLKIADFGLAAKHSSQHSKNHTNRVVTMWYRSPELLLGSTEYGPAVDMWSVGCILGELLLGMPILKGKNEIDQLFKIFELCGSPDEFNWPDVCKTPLYKYVKPSTDLKRRIRENFQYFGSHTVEFLDNLLALNPNQRWTAQQALDADYFWTDPLPADPKRLPKYDPLKVYVAKKRKQSEMEATREIPTPPPPWLAPSFSTLGQRLASQATSAWAPPNHGGPGTAPDTQAGSHIMRPFPNYGYGFGRKTQFKFRGRGQR